MRSLWARIENWLAGNAPEILENLNPGATDQEISSTEDFLGISFPEDVKDYYRIHNGQKSWVDTPDQQQWNYCLMDMWQLLSLARIQEEWSVWKGLLDSGEFNDYYMTLDTGMVSGWWNSKWIPLTSDKSGDHHCLNLSGIPDGSQGQIIMMWHDDDRRETVAPSFRAWLETFANDLEAGDYAYDPTVGCVVDLREESLD